MHKQHWDKQPVVLVYFTKMQSLSTTYDPTYFILF